MAGRRLMLNKELINQICVFIENGNANKDACSFVGISEATFYSWIVSAEEILAGKKRKSKKNVIYLEFLESLKGAEAKFRAFHVGNINAASKKEWTASAWMLERRYPKEFGRRLAAELQGVPDADGEPTPLSVMVYLPDNGRK